MTRTNVRVKALNDAIEYLFFHEGWIDAHAANRRIPLRKGIDMYPGAVLAISGATFKPPKHGIGGGYEVDEMRNGEVFQVVRMDVFQDPKGRIFDAYFVLGISRTGAQRRMVFHKVRNLFDFYLHRRCLLAQTNVCAGRPRRPPTRHSGHGRND